MGSSTATLDLTLSKIEKSNSVSHIQGELGHMLLSNTDRK